MSTTVLEQPVADSAGWRRWYRSALSAWTVPAGFVIGVVTALSLYDRRLLAGNPSIWRSVGSDVGSGLAAFRYYIDEPWTWPPFRVRSLGGLTSVTTTDSNAALAIVAKSLSFVGLGAEDWWGLWLVLVAALQGAAAVVAVRAFGVRRRELELSAAVLACFAPVFLFRVVHTNLMGQFVLLLGLAVVGHASRGARPVRAAHAGTALLVVAVLIHPYFLPLTAMLVVPAIVAEAVRGRIEWGSFARWAVSAASSVVIVLLVGGLVQSRLVPDDQGFVINTALLAWPVVPQRSGLWPGEQPFVHPLSSEGLAYLGAGVIVAAVVGAVAGRHRLVGWARTHQIVGAVCLLGVAYAVSPRVVVSGSMVWDLRTFDALPLVRGRVEAAALAIGAGAAMAAVAIRWRRVATWRPALLVTATGLLVIGTAGVAAPEVVSAVTSSLRASGRFVWPASYAVLVFGVVAVDRECRRSVAAALAVGCCVLQVVDTRPLHGWGDQVLIPTAERVAAVDELTAALAGHERVHVVPPLACAVSGGAAAFEAVRDTIMVASALSLPVDIELSARARSEPCPDEVVVDTDPAVVTVVAPPSVLPADGSLPPGAVCRQVGVLSVCSAGVRSTSPP